MRAIAQLLLCTRAWFRWAARACVPAPLVLYDAALGQVRTQALGAWVSLRLSEHLLALGSATPDELAKKSETHPHNLARLLRFALHEGWVTRRRTKYSANAVTRLLAQDCTASLAPFVRYFAAPSTSQAFLQMGAVVGVGADAYTAAYGCNVWDYFAAHSVEGKHFSDAMVSLTYLDAGSVAANYPFARHPRLCDVGGGYGQLVRAILDRYPQVAAVVVDQAAVAEAATQQLPPSLLPRLAFHAADFFDDRLPTADAYILRNVLHDWDDAACLRIFCNVRKSAAAGTTLLVVETLLEPRGTDEVAVLSDIVMLCATQGGRQRSEAHFCALLTKAKFRLVKRIRLSSPSDILVAEAIS